MPRVGPDNIKAGYPMTYLYALLALLVLIAFAYGFSWVISVVTYLVCRRALMEACEHAGIHRPSFRNVWHGQSSVLTNVRENRFEVGGEIDGRKVRAVLSVRSQDIFGEARIVTLEYVP